jgi:type VI secretion system protein ImpM
MSTPVALVFFGKLPSRGDFVRSTQQAPLTQTLDKWLTQALELMAQDPHWKPAYDQAVPLHFAFLGASNKAALAGHLLASTDASGRRFPFIAAGAFEVDQPLDFMGRSPLVLARLWSRFEQAARLACTATDATQQLADMNRAQVEIDTEPGAYDASYRDFLELQTVGGLQQILQSQHPDVDVRRVILALGLLLQPVPTSGSNQLEKGVRLPLPSDPMLQPLVATLWLDLVSRFLSRGDFEVVLFLPQAAREASSGTVAMGSLASASLAIGFAGGSPASLHAAMDRRVGDEVFVVLSRPEWVDKIAEQDYGVKKLAGYLEQPQLSLQQARATFREAFLGE